MILRCLEVEPGRRPASAAQLAFDLRHPGQVALTARAAKLTRDGWGAVLRRRFNPAFRPQLRRPGPAEALAAAPIIAVAVDVAAQPAALAEALRVTVGHVLATVPGARLACLNVLRQNRIALDQSLDAEGHNKHVQRLAELRHWAAPLGLPPERVTFHVLEAIGPAEALLDYVRQNPVDHVVLGARGETLRRKLLGSVSAEVAEKAPCTVTVVRAGQRGVPG